MITTVYYNYYQNTCMQQRYYLNKKSYTTILHPEKIKKVLHDICHWHGIDITVKQWL